jgi:adenylate cyclase
VREIARVQVVGRKEPVTVYEPMMPAEAEARKDTLDVFAKALACYYEGRLNDALLLFGSIETGDAPAAAYVQRCKFMLSQSQTVWTGVWTMTEK